MEKGIRFETYTCDNTSTIVAKVKVVARVAILVDMSMFDCFKIVCCRCCKGLSLSLKRSLDCLVNTSGF